MSKTEISQYGEFGLIRHLTEKFKLNNASSVKGVGDDAAVLDYQDKQVLVTTDLLLEGIHFDLVYTPLKHLGYKFFVIINQTVLLGFSKLIKLLFPLSFY